MQPDVREKRRENASAENIAIGLHLLKVAYNTMNAFIFVCLSNLFYRWKKTAFIVFTRLSSWMWLAVLITSIQGAFYSVSPLAKGATLSCRPLLSRDNLVPIFCASLPLAMSILGNLLILNVMVLIFMSYNFLIKESWRKMHLSLASCAVPRILL